MLAKQPIVMTKLQVQLATKLNQQSYARHKGLPIFMQRVMAIAILAILSPLIILTAAFIKLESRGPIFFSQTRVGENGRRFTCYKMRSMRIPSDPLYQEPEKSDSDREGVCMKFFKDPRITRIGKVIRKLSIDELPQLFNVVKGDMALVGPRPHLVNEYNQYDRKILGRLFCKPGITGMWQVNGRADTSFDEQLELDKSYIKHQSSWLDIKILLATIPCVLIGKGAY